MHLQTPVSGGTYNVHYNIILWLWFAVIVICIFSFFSLAFHFRDFHYAFGMCDFRERSRLQKWRKAPDIMHTLIHCMNWQGNAHKHRHTLLHNTAKQECIWNMVNLNCGKYISLHIYVSIRLHSAFNCRLWLLLLLLIHFFFLC